MPTFQRHRAPIGRKTVLWLLPFAFANGLLSAIRWPQTYALSHMIIDYHFGFGKRGFIGLILHLIDRPPYHYVTLASMAFAVFALWLGTLAVAAWRDMRRDTGLAVAFVMFFLSAGFASLVSDVGRGEHFGLLMAVPCLLMPVPVAWLPARAALLAAAVLMQEINFVIVAPVIALDAWIGSRPRSSFRPVIYAAATILPALILTLYLGNIQTACDRTSATAYYQHMAADFPFRAVPLYTLCANGGENIRLAWDNLWADSAKAVTIPLALSVALPSMLFNLWLAARALSGRAIAIVASAVAAAAPVTLLILGIDVVRFVTLVQVTSLLVLVSVVRRVGVPAGGTLPHLPHRAALVTVLAAFQVGTGLTLNDGSEMMKFPFTPLVVRAVAIAQGRAPFVVIQ